MIYRRSWWEDLYWHCYFNAIELSREQKIRIGRFREQQINLKERQRGSDKKDVLQNHVRVNGTCLKAWKKILGDQNRFPTVQCMTKSMIIVPDKIFGCVRSKITAKPRRKSTVDTQGERSIRKIHLISARMKWSSQKCIMTLWTHGIYSTGQKFVCNTLMILKIVPKISREMRETLKPKKHVLALNRPNRTF